jgi:hypothetical protein
LAITENFGEFSGGYAVLKRVQQELTRFWRCSDTSFQINELGFCREVDDAKKVAPFLLKMEKSLIIIAINKDPLAPIFEVADYGIVDDFQNVIPILKEKAKRMK